MHKQIKAQCKDILLSNLSWLLDANTFTCRESILHAEEDYYFKDVFMATQDLTSRFQYTKHFNP